MSSDKTDYVALAHFLSSNPQAISLLRFRELNLRNLLYYQAELVQLQGDLNRLEIADSTIHTESKERVTFLWSEIALSPNGRVQQQSTSISNAPIAIPQTIQGQSNLIGTATPAHVVNIADAYRAKVLQIRETLSKYNEALDCFSRLEKLPNPSQRTLDKQREWLRRSDLGLSALSGTIEDVWHQQWGYRPLDFLTFASAEGISEKLTRIAIWIQRLFDSDRRPNQVYSADASNEGGMAKGVSVIVSSLFPVLPIVVLFFIPSLIARIGTILAFTAVFAAILVFVLKLSPEKVLTITTAIAAVQVVYVGSTAHGLEAT